MARNIEIKARIVSIQALVPKAAAIADEGPVEIIQDDTFFRCEAGRLKLRAFSQEAGELIFYRRANQQGPKESVGVREAQHLMVQLGVEPSQLIEGAYVDMLADQR